MLDAIKQDKEFEQKFKILYSAAQIERDFNQWRSEADGVSNYSIGMIFLDIDDFKRLNTAHSETVVDKTILPDFQRLLANLCMHRAVAYRYGGEEFVILLPNCQIDEAGLFAQKVCTLIAVNTFNVEDKPVQITVSIGVASWPDSGNEFNQIIEIANQEEHKAKEQGKNRVCIVGNPQYPSMSFQGGNNINVKYDDLPIKKGLLMWLDASDIHSLFQQIDTTQPVSTKNPLIGSWVDKSGNENNFLQPQYEARPLFVKTGIGGKPSIAFNTKQSIFITRHFPAPVTVIYVAKQTGGSNKRVLSAMTNNWLLGYWSNAKNQAFYEGWVSPEGSPHTDNLPHVFAGIVRGPGRDSEVWADGAMVETNQKGVTGPNGLAINAGQFSREVSDCQVAEIIVYNIDISQSERQKVETFLMEKWGIKRPEVTIAPPAQSNPKPDSHTNTTDKQLEALLAAASQLTLSTSRDDEYKKIIELSIQKQNYRFALSVTAQLSMSTYKDDYYGKTYKFALTKKEFNIARTAIS